ncbi:MAG: PilZ domain-containing protein [Methylobacterium sp.]|uniref:PilZ domain-containing protein n=1 Tax=Methylobacterium sp. TaxID=409 RepID=UPI0025CEAAD5|nr:PilZ domain-containing protein [Methylobacterium sp.]MBX9931354.1 PilZ domain-containing protein [Methylobacterium sp.]
MPDDRTEPHALATVAPVSRRHPRRHRVMQQARILIGRETVLFCVVRDLSQEGAKIRLHRLVALPPRFELMIAAHDLRTFEVELRWQRGEFAGVTFLRKLGVKA